MREAVERCQRAMRDIVAGCANLGAERTEALFGDIMAGQLEAEQIAGLLMALATRRETSEEILGAAVAMRRALVHVPVADGAIDTCGTGGSGVPRRNVSTAASLVLAACGVRVAKHGNRAASSRSGSADVLEALGVDIAAPPATVGRCVDEVGVGFLFARALHPAMGHAAPVRRALGVPTIFNLLGPMTNPARTRRQVMGVFDPSRLRDIARALSAMGSERVFVLHGFRQGITAGPGAPRGIDDLSPEGETLVVEARGDALVDHVLTPEHAGLSRRPLQDLAGGDPEDNAQALAALLEGASAGPREVAYREAVAYAAGLGMVVAGEGDLSDLPASTQRALTALDDGSAAAVLSELVRLSRTRPVGEDNG